ncbi:MAG: MotA/TolQ/ExbB proton channel family protein [Chitinophagia bacterium]|nr:MotA/TolQ/ExbB proton channel family protein [Chitinophagia bacterium]
MTLLQILLLQITDTGHKPVAPIPPPPAATEEISLIHLIQEGGVLMIPLLFCSLIMVYVFIERWMFLRKAIAGEDTFMARLKEEIKRGDLSGAKLTCKNTPALLARIIEKALNSIGKPIDAIEKSMENTGKFQVYAMEKNLSILSTITAIAPVFGFLGTIAGMIILFFNVQHQGFSLPNIAGGIYTKMVTSAAGLIIGLMSQLAFTYLNVQINKQVHKFEASSVEFLELIQEHPLK